MALNIQSNSCQSNFFQLSKNQFILFFQKGWRLKIRCYLVGFANLTTPNNIKKYSTIYMPKRVQRLWVIAIIASAALGRFPQNLQHRCKLFHQIVNNYKFSKIQFFSRGLFRSTKFISLEQFSFQSLRFRPFQ